MVSVTMGGREDCGGEGCGRDGSDEEVGQGEGSRGVYSEYFGEESEYSKDDGGKSSQIGKAESQIWTLIQ